MICVANWNVKDGRRRRGARELNRQTGCHCRLHRWFFPVVFTALFFGLLGSFVRAWGEWLVDVIYG